MSTNPERPIERLLRQAAKQRRADAGEPGPLHPATRRLLQGEVTRQYGQVRAARPAPAGWLRFWPRLAWATGLAAVMGAGLWLAFRQDGPKPAYEVSAVTDGPAPAAAPAVNAYSRLEVASAPVDGRLSGEKKDFLAGETEEFKLRLKDKQADRENLVAGLAGQVETNRFALDAPKPGGGFLAAENAPASRSLAEVGKTEALRPRAEALTRDAFDGAAPKELAQSQAAGTQLFSNVAPAAKPKSAAKVEFEVLNSFAIEQTGPEMRVVDADGSVYVGQMEPPTAAGAALPSEAEPAKGLSGARGGMAAAPPATAATTPVKPQAQVASTEANQVNALNYNFRVVGTNRSLNQKVVFTGNMVAMDDSLNRLAQDGASTLNNSVPLGSSVALDSLAARESAQSRRANQFSNQSRQVFQNQAQASNRANTVVANSQTSQSNRLGLSNQLNVNQLNFNQLRNAAPMLQRARINGRAQVGERQQVDVDALPQSP